MWRRCLKATWPPRGNVTVGVILFVFFAVMTVVILYGVFVLREEERRGGDPADFRAVGPLRYNKAIGRKAAVLSFVGFLGILLVSFYMQTLFALSSKSVANNERAVEVEQTIQRAERAPGRPDRAVRRALPGQVPRGRLRARPQPGARDPRRPAGAGRRAADPVRLRLRRGRQPGGHELVLCELHAE